jgi:hypothetical protein
MFVDPSGHFLDPITIGIIVGALVGGGTAAAQGGNIWKGALAGAIAGAFGGLGWATGDFICMALCSAAGGALGALVTGGDPGMAAATAAISSIISFGLFSEGGIFGSFTGSQTEQYIKMLTASTGVGALMGGISAEIFGGDFGEGALWGAASAAASYMLSAALYDDGSQSDDLLKDMELPDPDLTMDLIELAPELNPGEPSILLASADPSTADEGIIAHESIVRENFNPPKGFWQRLAGGKEYADLAIKRGARYVRQFAYKRTLPQFEKHLLRNGWKRIPCRGDAKGVKLFMKGARRYVLRPGTASKSGIPTADYLKIIGRKGGKVLGKIRLVGK